MPADRSSNNTLVHQGKQAHPSSPGRTRAEKDSTDRTDRPSLVAHAQTPGPSRVGSTNVDNSDLDMSDDQGHSKTPVTGARAKPTHRVGYFSYSDRPH